MMSSDAIKISNVTDGESSNETNIAGEKRHMSYFKLRNGGA
jgi:hypothetical protein